MSNKSELKTVFLPRNYLDVERADHVLDKTNFTEAKKKHLSMRLDFERRIGGNKPRFFNKNPGNIVTVEFLRECFPDCYVIHVIRDGRAVVNSLMFSLPDEVETYDRYKPPWKRINPWPGVRPPNWRELLNDDPLVQHATQWAQCVAYILDRKDDLLPNYVEIRYEELCSDTRSTIGKAWEAAGLESTKETRGLLPATLDSKNFKFQERFTPEVVDRISAVMRPILDRLNYF